MFEGPVGSPLSPLKELNCSSCGIIYIADNITVTGAYPLKFPVSCYFNGHQYLYHYKQHHPV